LGQPEECATICIDSEFDQIGRARDFVEAIARRIPMSEPEIYDMVLAVDEAVTNVIEHAYGGLRGRTVELLAEYAADHFTIIITHHGASFDPSGHQDPVMKEHLAQRRVGGLGLYLMRQLMDLIEYGVNSNGAQQIRMVKYRQTPC